MKAKYGENVKSCYMNTDSFIVCIKTVERLIKWKNNRRVFNIETKKL